MGIDALLHTGQFIIQQAVVRMPDDPEPHLGTASRALERIASQRLLQALAVGQTLDLLQTGDDHLRCPLQRGDDALADLDQDTGGL